MRTWVASMDRFDVLVDAGNSPLLPSTATRYRSQRASSGLPWRTISSIYRFSIGSLSRDPFCYIYYPLALFILFVLDRMLTSLFSPLSLSPFCRTCPFAVLRFYYPRAPPIVGVFILNEIRERTFQRKHHRRAR